MTNPDDFCDFHCIDPDTGATLEWEWIGEGDDGNYDPKDPEDTPRLRANLQVPWREEVFSYCTLATPDAPKVKLQKLAKDLFSQLNSGTSPKRPMEYWTWDTATAPQGETA